MLMAPGRESDGMVQADLLGREFKCICCAHQTFFKPRVSFGMGGVAPVPRRGFRGAFKTGVVCLVCERCGYIHWFWDDANDGRGPRLK